MPELEILRRPALQVLRRYGRLRADFSRLPYRLLRLHAIVPIELIIFAGDHIVVSGVGGGSKCGGLLADRLVDRPYEVNPTCTTHKADVTTAIVRAHQAEFMALSIAPSQSNDSSTLGSRFVSLIGRLRPGAATSRSHWHISLMHTPIYKGIISGDDSMPIV